MLDIAPWIYRKIEIGSAVFHFDTKESPARNYLGERVFYTVVTAEAETGRIFVAQSGLCKLEAEAMETMIAHVKANADRLIAMHRL